MNKDNRKLSRDVLEHMLAECGISATPNRMLVLRSVAEAEHPISLMEIDTRLETLDKSSISRVLALLEKNSLIHMMLDGRGITKYELCRGHDHCHSEEDMHIHFYCHKCRKTYCFEDLGVPQVALPPGFEVDSVNFMLMGICPECRHSN